MEFPRSSAVSARLEHVPFTGSTNDDLVRRVSGADASTWPHLSVVVTRDQRAGRGRAGRVWTAPAGSSLAASVLLRIDGIPQGSWGWFPLLAGTAMARAVRAALPAGVAGSDVTLKWPNDVLIDGRKVCGILCELLASPSAVVVGSGVNVTLTADDLPTDTSTSLLLAGAEAPDADALLADYLAELDTLATAFASARGDAVVSGVRDAVVAECGTLGRRVRVELPGGNELRGTAVDIDEVGRVRIRSGPDGRTTAVAAGDVTHLRY
ncbi:biotin--[acetyl-CoA-carboxylase] ligase [Planctomonas psychrotolerans]|uniref:biotin--[acetyl-CoA-carboxylase] ligase n=1 Tax=Planctomonas psychrotolerans TaxID=2528712 RepID=UPI00123B7C1C|nr:biotin--[acetyl-CoA-carboxylase] ligase [Planctomonas psychrotolerans]